MAFWDVGANFLGGNLIACPALHLASLIFLAGNHIDHWLSSVFMLNQSQFS